jgi:hypothetical protein
MPDKTGLFKSEKKNIKQLQMAATSTHGLRQCRHCAGFSLEDRTTYASVLVAGNIFRSTVESLEERIVPCVTAVCPECDRVSLISDGSTESMLCSIFMWQSLREWIDTSYSTADVSLPADIVIKDDSVRLVKTDIKASMKIGSIMDESDM